MFKQIDYTMIVVSDMQRTRSPRLEFYSNSAGELSVLASSAIADSANRG